MYPRWRKQRRTWTFHIFRGSAQLLPNPGGAISHRQSLSQSLSPRQHPPLTCGCRLWRPSSTTFSLEPQMQALYRIGMANTDMLRGISLAAHPINWGICCHCCLAWGLGHYYCGRWSLSCWWWWRGGARRRRRGWRLSIWREWFTFCKTCFVDSPDLFYAFSFQS